VDELSDLMSRYAQGDDLAFDRLYELLSPRLCRFCLRLVPRRWEAQDLFQETFLRLHRARGAFVPGSNVIPWAFAIARSVSLDRRRYRRRRPEDLGSAKDAAELERPATGDGHNPEGTARARDLFELIGNELATLSEGNRLAFVLLREEGLSVDEAAAVLGTTKDAVKQRAHRASEQIRAALEAAGWKEDSDGDRWPAVSIRA